MVPGKRPGIWSRGTCFLSVLSMSSSPGLPSVALSFVSLPEFLDVLKHYLHPLLQILSFFRVSCQPSTKETSVLTMENRFRFSQKYRLKKIRRWYFEVTGIVCRRNSFGAWAFGKASQENGLACVVEDEVWNSGRLHTYLQASSFGPSVSGAESGPKGGFLGMRHGPIFYGQIEGSDLRIFEYLSGKELPILVARWRVAAMCGFRAPRRSNSIHFGP